MKIEHFSKTHPQVPKDEIELPLSSPTCIVMKASACQHGELKNILPIKKEKWKKVKNVFAIRSLVLKNDIATMYNEYIAKHDGAVTEKVHIRRSVFYTTVKHITGGGKH